MTDIKTTDCYIPIEFLNPDCDVRVYRRNRNGVLEREDYAEKKTDMICIPKEDFIKAKAIIEDALPIVIAFAAIQTHGVLNVHPQHQELIDRMNAFLETSIK